MGNQKMSGLTLRGGIWHIDKVFRGTRIRESTGTGEVEKAQEQLARRIEEVRLAKVFGTRLDRTFRTAATKFLSENQHKRSIDDDAMHAEKLVRFIGDLPLRQVHMDSLQPFIAKRRAEGVTTTTINLSLAFVRRVINLAATEWRDEQGLTWLENAAKIKLLKVTDRRQPYPLSQEEQGLLFRELPDYLARMALFKVNTGTREEEVCGLKWVDEVSMPELGTSVFIVSGDKVKNGHDRLIVLNRVARSVIESVRGQDSEYVFVRFPKPPKVKAGYERVIPQPVRVQTMNATAWKSVRVRAAKKWEERTGRPAPEGFRRVRVHDLKHTFGRRLRAAGVSFEDRQDLLGHKNARITTHYSAAEVSNLITAAEKACADGNPRNSPAITCLEKRVGS
ncbi:MAG TPA: site-specific integrase [Steroidobacteraceae bacterium]